jgi:hypothetical protein
MVLVFLLSFFFVSPLMAQFDPTSGYHDGHPYPSFAPGSFEATNNERLQQAIKEQQIEQDKEKKEDLRANIKAIGRKLL